MNVEKNILLEGAFVGFIAGMSVALGGAVKDAPYEGFKPITFFRSPVVGSLVGMIIKLLNPTIDNKVLFFAVIGGERFIVESWKILRTKKPSKFDNGEWGFNRPTLKKVDKK